MSNLRPLPLRVDDPRAAADPRAWLAAQPEDVRAVTRVAADGSLCQVPSLHPEAFVDPTALLFGGVILGRRCYVGPYAVVRLDEKPDPAPLVVGDGTNIQDGAVVHSTSQRIGARVIVAHQAIVHGAQVKDDVTISTSRPWRTAAAPCSAPARSCTRAATWARGSASRRAATWRRGKKS